MKSSPDGLRSHCPVNFALETFGDRWTLLILRDIVFRGKKRYSEFLKSEEGFATNILAARLESLTFNGILRREDDETDGRKAAYTLTEKGLELIPLLFEMVLWSARHDPLSEARQIPQLVELIRKNNRAISRTAAKTVRRGEGVLPRYLSSNLP